MDRDVRAPKGETLVDCLRQYWSSSFGELPSHLRRAVEARFYPFAWDHLDEQQRLERAQQVDQRRDPAREPSLHWQLLNYVEDVLKPRLRSMSATIESGKASDGTIANAGAIAEVIKGLEQILSADRSQVGGELQALRRQKAEAPAPDPSDLPEELDIANQAYRAVLNDRDENETFRNQLVAYLEKTHADLVPGARERIATVANPDKQVGRPAGRKTK